MFIVAWCFAFLLFMVFFLGWMELSTRNSRAKSEEALQRLLKAPEAIQEFEMVDKEILSIRVTMKDQAVIDLTDIESRIVDDWFTRLQAGAPAAEAWLAIRNAGTLRRARAEPSRLLTGHEAQLRR